MCACAAGAAAPPSGPERQLICMIGPPADPGRDADMVRTLLAFPGAKAVCGGTTANLVARALGEEVRVHMETAAPGLPPAGTLPGVDLVCEGVITLNRVLKMLAGGPGANSENGAACLYRLLLRAETIKILFGRAGNPVRQSVGPGPADKQRLVLDLQRRLQEMGKNVNIEIF